MAGSEPIIIFFVTTISDTPRKQVELLVLFGVAKTCWNWIGFKRTKRTSHHKRSWETKDLTHTVSNEPATTRCDEHWPSEGHANVQFSGWLFAGTGWNIMLLSPKIDATGIVKHSSSCTFCVSEKMLISSLLQNPRRNRDEKWQSE